MAVAIPVIAAFASGAVGAVVAGTATFGAYLTVAGAALSTLGAVTGKEDLMKLGGVLSIGGGLASGFGVGGEGVSAAAATEQAARESFRAAEYADMAKYAGEGAGNAAANSTAGLDQAMSGAQNSGVTEAIDPLERANESFMASEGAGSSIFERASASASPAVQPAAGDGASILERLSATQEPSSFAMINRQALQPGVSPSAALPSGVTINGQVLSVNDPLSSGANTLTSSQVDQLNARSANRLQGSLSNVGKWVRENKELAQLGGQMLSAMNDPRADQLDFERSIYARRMRNLNNPVALTFGRT